MRVVARTHTHTHTHQNEHQHTRKLKLKREHTRTHTHQHEHQHTRKLKLKREHASARMRPIYRCTAGRVLSSAPGQEARARGICRKAGRVAGAAVIATTMAEAFPLPTAVAVPCGRK
jgi:hypothetical protein